MIISIVMKFDNCFIIAGQGSTTQTYDALRTIREEIIQQTRPEANLFVILFTDGSSTGKKSVKKSILATIYEADQLKSSRSMKVITVGVGVSYP